MTANISWNQSKEIRTNIMSLINDTIKENRKLMKLQYEILQKQLVESGAIKLSDTDVEVNVFSIYEKQEEMAECESNIKDNLYILEIALLDDSDLIFMNINEIEDHVDDCNSNMENYIAEIDELKGEMEEL